MDESEFLFQFRVSFLGCIRHCPGEIREEGTADAELPAVASRSPDQSAENVAAAFI